MLFNNELLPAHLYWFLNKQGCTSTDSVLFGKLISILTDEVVWYVFKTGSGRGKACDAVL